MLQEQESTSEVNSICMAIQASPMECQMNVSCAITGTSYWEELKNDHARCQQKIQENIMLKVTENDSRVTLTISW